MSRHVVIRVGDNYDVARIIGHLGSQDDLVGVYAAPNSICECPPKRRENIANWVKAKGWGIPICKHCRRPSRYWVIGIEKRLAIALGNPEADQVQ
jgi:hypothetical protein